VTSVDIQRGERVVHLPSGQAGTVVDLHWPDGGTVRVLVRLSRGVYGLWPRAEPGPEVPDGGDPTGRRCIGCGKPAAVDPTCGRCPACKHLVQVEARPPRRLPWRRGTGGWSR